VSSTATTLCAFLPMLFWPGIPGEFMGMLPVTLIFVLSASLVVALVYLPVVGGVAGRISRAFGRASDALRRLPWLLRGALVVGAAGLLWTGTMQALNPGYLPGLVAPGSAGLRALLPGMLIFLAGAVAVSITVGAVKPLPRPKLRATRRRTPFGHFIKLIAGNPVMPLVVIAAVGGFVAITFSTFAENSRGVEFFVETEPERAIAYIRARGNLGLEEKDAIVQEAERRIMAVEGVESVFAFAGEGGLNQNTGGAQAPLDTIGQVQVELEPWDARADGNLILDRILADIRAIPGIEADILEQARGPASGKPVHLRLKADNWDDLHSATAAVRAKFEATEGLTDVEDTRPLPGIDWQIDVDVEKAGRYGADVATVGAMVQLVTRGLLLDTMRVESSDEEIDIRVRLPERDRVLATLDTLKVRTADGLVPLSNFITRQPVQKLAKIDRVDQSRYFDVKADVAPGLTNAAGQPITANERIAALTGWLEDAAALPQGVSFEWTGDQEDQAESQQFLMTAFAGALGLMFIILLAQFNSFYNAVLVLMAVVLSTTGVLIGMLVMDQTFSIIMTGTGIVALAGIVVNNNIVLIDTYQEYSAYMPRIEAIVRTAEARIRPVLLTTITTMAGLTPMMFGLSIDFINGGYTVDSPTALWWKQLATAVVFGLGTATVLTLVFTPSLLALRVWASKGAYGTARLAGRLALGRASRVARDAALRRAARKHAAPLILWDAPAEPGGRGEDAETPGGEGGKRPPLRAAE
jgi:multidrug efflux pump